MKFGTCWTGFAQNFFNRLEVGALLDLPAGLVSVAPIVVDRPKKAFSRSKAKMAEIRWIGWQIYDLLPWVTK
jgi:hypothetical protein